MWCLDRHRSSLTSHPMLNRIRAVAQAYFPAHYFADLPPCALSAALVRDGSHQGFRLSGWTCPYHQVFGSGEIWSNFEDYEPLMNMARDTGNRVLASNAPRRFTSFVAKVGVCAWPRYGCLHGRGRGVRMAEVGVPAWPR